LPLKFKPITRTPTPTSPKKIATPIEVYDDKISHLGKITKISKNDIIKNFENQYFSFMFWSCIHTKTLGTFIVVKTPDTKIHFISMRKKLLGCNFQYNFSRKCIYTKDCTDCFYEYEINEEDLVYYDFPDDLIVLTPDEPYEIPNILCKI